MRPLGWKQASDDAIAVLFNGDDLEEHDRFALLSGTEIGGPLAITAIAGRGDGYLAIRDEDGEVAIHGTAALIAVRDECSRLLDLAREQKESKV